MKLDMIQEQQLKEAFRMAEHRISTLESLLREVSEKTTNGQMCIMCSQYGDGKIHKHDSECPITRIQKELGEV